MNAIVEERKVLTPQTRRELTERARAVWASGDFARMGVRNVLAGELLCRSLDIHTGERVLDVAAGSGNAAIAAARRGAHVTATDFVAALLAVASARAEVEGLPLETAVADAQELPFADASFDVVLSTFGAIFAPDARLAAAELVRVCRPGGRIGLTSWTPEGLIGQYGAISMRHLPAAPRGAPAPSPLRWGTEEGVRELLGGSVTELRFERRLMDMCAESADAAVSYNRTWFGPTRTLFAQLEGAAADALAAELSAHFERFNRAIDGTLVAEAEYLEVVAVKA